MNLNMWTETENALETTLRFKDFAQAWAFMTETALAAERLGHHPDWRNVWSKVEIRLSTHDAGDVVTEKDRALAAEIDRIAARYLKG